jgi:hypothetical protein
VPGIRTRRGILEGIMERVEVVSSRRRRILFSREPEYGEGRVLVAAERVACKR